MNRKENLMMKKVNLFGVVLAVLTAVAGPFAVTKSDAQCTFTFDSASAHFTTAGGTGSVTVTASDPSCSWAAISYSPFVSITSTQDFTGNGTVTYTVSNNTNLVGFTGEMVIAGQVYLVYQDAFSTPRSTFYGIVLPNNAPSQTGSGTITLQLSSGGTFSSAVIALGGVRTSFRGRFDGAGNFSSNSIARPKLGPLQLDLQLDLFDGADSITGTVSDGSFTSTVFAAVASNNRTNNCPAKGSYTFVLAPANSSDPSVPQGYGYGMLTVAKSGVTKMQGVLGDGTKITGNVPTSLDATWPLYNLLYNKGLGSCAGLIVLPTNSAFTFISSNPVTSPAPPEIVSSSNTAFSASVDWIKPPQATDKLYPGGFTTSVTLTGATFVSGFIPVGSNTVTLGGGNLASNIVKTVSIDTNAVVTVLDPGGDRMAMVLSPFNGQFFGSFVDTTAGLTRQFSGVLVSTNHLGAGYFIGTSQSGFVILQPVP